MIIVYNLSKNTNILSVTFFKNVKLESCNITFTVLVWCKTQPKNIHGTKLNNLLWVSIAITNTTCGTNVSLSGRPSFCLKIYAKKGHNSLTIAIRVKPLVLQLHLVMMSKHSKFGVDTFNTFWVTGYIKDFV